MKRVIFIVVLASISLIGFTQSYDISNKKMLFGIGLSLNRSLSKFDNDFEEHNIKGGGGFSIDIISELIMSRYFSLSPKFGLTFNDEYLVLDKNKYQLLAVTTDFVLHLLVKSGKKKLNPYILIGPSYNRVITGKNKSVGDWSDKSNVALDFGSGMEIYFKHFVMAPELKYSYGLVDVNSSIELSSIKHHTVSLSFSFKG